jgi:hypothetical protein
MGVLDLVKKPEVAFLLGMPVGYFAIDFGRKKISSYMKSAGEEMGRNIAEAIKRQGASSELPQGYVMLDRKLDTLLSRMSDMEKKVYKGE